MFGIWDVLLLLGFLVILLLIYLSRSIQSMQRKGIKALPTQQIVANIFRVFGQRIHVVDSIDLVYKTFREDKYAAFYQLHVGSLVIRDLELIKMVGVKDFDHFMNHVSIIDEEKDPMFGNNLFSLQGRKWKEMRATLSPAFTGSKMRNMFNYMVECGKYMSEHYSERMKAESSDVIEIELNDLFSKYTNDVIATSAFGIKVNSLKEDDNEFRRMGELSTNFTYSFVLKAIGYSLMPKFMKYFKITMLPSVVINFFTSLVLDQMKNRRENNIIRPDIIHLLMEARKGSLKHEKIIETGDAGFATVEESEIGTQDVKRQWSDYEIIAQTILFFVAGFKTTSTMLSFMCSELASNEVVQKRLQNEIDELAAKSGENPSYDDIQGMKYMDMVVSETLRKWPPVVFLERECSKDYKFPPNDGREYTMNKGESICVPVFSIHRDPEYYPNPDVFDPERFSDENKCNIRPLTFLPFGIGPRNCIGCRFALTEIKSAVFQLLYKFNFVKVSKTSDPLIMSPKHYHPRPENGFWIGLKKRNTISNFEN